MNAFRFHIVSYHIACLVPHVRWCWYLNFDLVAAIVDVDVDFDFVVVVVAVGSVRCVVGWYDGYDDYDDSDDYYGFLCW